MSSSLKYRTASAFAWSILQSWSVKFISLALFFVLARYLAPDQMGLAQTVTVLLAFVAILSEQGFQSAIVQRPGLLSSDVNLPFFIVTGTAALASVAMLLFADTLAHWLKEPAAAQLIRIAAVIPPVTAANGILIALFRRELDFRSVAKASLCASLVSGGVALYLVINGWGAMSLVLQTAITALVTSAVLWLRPAWKPTSQIETRHFRSLLGFSSANFLSQLIDFFSGRLLDIIILSRYGLSALGIYAVGSKLYLTILELLATALMSVAMSAMSKLQGDSPRLKPAYLRLLYLASCSTLPLFVGVAALAPEVCLILFGNKWDDAVPVTRWLCLLGSIQVVQFFNGAALDATGKPRRVLFINLAKLSVGVAVLSLYPTDSIAQLTLAFVLAQLCVSPISFSLAMHTTGALPLEVLEQVMPGLAAATLAYFSVSFMRDASQFAALGVWLSVFAFSLVFTATFAASIFIFSKNKLLSELKYAISGYQQ